MSSTEKVITSPSSSSKPSREIGMIMKYRYDNEISVLQPFLTIRKIEILSNLNYYGNHPESCNALFASSNKPTH